MCLASPTPTASPVTAWGRGRCTRVRGGPAVPAGCRRPVAPRATCCAAATPASGASAWGVAGLGHVQWRRHHAGRQVGQVLADVSQQDVVRLPHSIRLALQVDGLAPRRHVCIARAYSSNGAESAGAGWGVGGGVLRVGSQTQWIRVMLPAINQRTSAIHVGWLPTWLQDNTLSSKPTTGRV